MSRPSLMSLAVLYLCGCIPNQSVRSLAKAGVGGAAAGVIENREDVRRALREVLLADDVLAQMTERMVAGALMSLSEVSQQQRVEALAGAVLKNLRERGDEALARMLKSAGGELERTLLAVSADSIRSADDALKGILRKDLPEAVQIIVRNNAETLARVIARELDGQLGRSLEHATQQMARSMVSEMALSLRQEENQRALQDVLRSVTREAVHGAGDGLRSELSSSRQAGLIAGLVTVCIILLTVLTALGFLIHHYRQSTKALSIIAQKINESAPAAAPLKQAIREGAQKNQVDGWLSDFLKRRGL